MRSRARRITPHHAERRDGNKASLSTAERKRKREWNDGNKKANPEMDSEFASR
ncbi:hypothetical protein [Gimesia panareensis]|uniref:hypothetical protein n=1 Tax=Gimesia panareensis TaxID=2527978 RepID=UPI0018D8D8BC|nr:hypothetical protein [Gimesia panareensis]